MAKKLLFPDDVRALLARRYRGQHGDWLLGEGAWPLSVALTNLTERDVAADVGLVRAWVDAWQAFREGGEVVWGEVTWRKLGAQRLPQRLELAQAGDVARLIGEGTRFQRASQRYEAWVARSDRLRGARFFARHFDVLADYADEDVERLTRLCTWLLAHPRSGLSVRQLPVEGLHTKWLDKARRTLVVELLAALRGDGSSPDFYDATGLARPPHRLRLCVLCPELRRHTAGLRDLEAPLDELTQLAFSPPRVLLVENLESGLALPDLPGTVALVGLGNAVGVLTRIPWLADSNVIYWGDIDTHGLAILDRARAALGEVTSVMMDEATLLSNRSLWGREDAQCGELELPHLTRGERELFDQLRAQTWGVGVRLEQERIPWSCALAALSKVCGL